MALCVPAWMQQPCFLVLVLCFAGAADVEAVQDAPITFNMISPLGSAHNSFMRSEPQKHSIIRSRVRPPLWPVDQQHLAHDDDEHTALVEADEGAAQEPAGDGNAQEPAGQTMAEAAQEAAGDGNDDGDAQVLAGDGDGDDGGTPAMKTTHQTVLAKGPVVSSAASQKEMESVSTSIGVMLLGMVAFTMSLFYAAHFPDPDVQHTTWVTISETISLFCGVLLFTTFKDIMVVQFGETGGHHDSQPTLWSMILSLLRTLLLFWGVQALLSQHKKSPWALKACGSIGGNVIAFAAIDCFGMIQQVSPFRDNPGMAFLGMCLGGVLIFSMCLSAYIVRHNKMTKEDGIIKDHDMNWDDACKQVENQFASICLGLLFSIVIRQAITGTMPAVWGSPHNKTQEQVNRLFGVTLGLSVPVFALSLVVFALKGLQNSLPGLVRSARVTQLILSMSMGWSLVFCGQWEFWSSTSGNGVGLGDKMTARMIDALVFSYISFGFIIALDFLADNVKMAKGGLQAVSSAFTLGLALTWQGAFSEAVTCLSNRYHDKTTRLYMDALITFCLCGIVMPAWALYMLPKALAGPQPLEGSKTQIRRNSASWKGEGTEGEESSQSGSEAAGVGMGKAAEAEVAAATDKELCNNCGAEFVGDVLFCENCGAKRAIVDVPEEPKSAQKAGGNITPPGETAGTRVSRGEYSAGGKGSGKAAASGGKGGRVSGRSSATTVPAATPAGDDQTGGSQQEQTAEAWEGQDESWGGAADTGGDPAPSF